MNNSCPKYLDLGTAAGARRIAVRVQPGEGPRLFWLGGFKSDMGGTKAQALAAWAAQKGRGCVRFDYAGHGFIRPDDRRRIYRAVAEFFARHL